MNKYITYLFLLLLSCGKPQDNNGIFTMDLSKDDLPKTTVSLDDYTTKWTRIDLETTEDCLLDPSFNIYPTDHFIVAYSFNRILVFDHTGHFIREISHFGEGPDEHGLLFNCTVNPTSEQLVFVEMGNTEEIIRYDLSSGKQLTAIPIVAKKQLCDLLFIKDSTLVCFPYAGNQKQMAYKQNLAGEWIGTPPIPISEPAGPYNPIPISLFQVDNQWIYKGIYEDTLYLVNNLEPFARFSRKDISPSKTELEEQNSSFINHLFTSNGMSLFGYPQYQLKEVSEGIFDLVLVDFRAFLFNHADKQILEIEKMNCPPLSIIYEQKNLNDLFMLISSRNPKKLVLKVPAEFMGKEEDENPVLFISDLIYPKKKQPTRGKP